MLATYDVSSGSSRLLLLWPAVEPIDDASIDGEDDGLGDDLITVR